MIKGSQKQMIVVRMGDSRYFDEAYFVLRREVKTGTGCRGDILCEANRILQESIPEHTPRRSLRALLYFVGGVLSGGGVCAALFLHCKTNTTIRVLTFEKKYAIILPSYVTV